MTAQKRARPKKAAPAAPKPDFSEFVGRLARTHQLGTVGLAGAHATGSAGAACPVELFVTVPLDHATAFGEQLAAATGRAVHLYDPHALPSAHPLHFAVQWLNVTTLPRVLVRRGSTLRQLDGRPVCIPFSQVPHFAEVDAPPPPRGRPMLTIQPPPIGAFLL